MNGQRIYLSKDKKTLFVRIPRDKAEKCGQCSCEYCMKHPEYSPQWDTLAIDLEKGGNTWTVHFPGLETDGSVSHWNGKR